MADENQAEGIDQNIRKKPVVMMNLVFVSEMQLCLGKESYFDEDLHIRRMSVGNQRNSVRHGEERARRVRC